MALGNEIVLGNDPRGRFMEGLVSGTPKPGTCMEISPAVEKVSGRFTYRVYQPGTDGEQRPVIVLLADQLQGQTADDAYVTGTRCFLYMPLPGDELNMRYADVAGTGDDHSIGGMMMIDTGTGLLINSTGTPESEPFVCLETVTDPTTEALRHSLFTGY